MLKTAGWTVMPAVGAAASGPLYARAGRNTARIDLPAGVWSAPATAAAAPQGGLIGDRPSDEQSGSPSQTDGWLGVYVARP